MSCGSRIRSAVVFLVAWAATAAALGGQATDRPAAAGKRSGGDKTAERGPIRYGPGRELCRLENRGITESSGLACGRLNPGVFWTHNDSGDTARVFAFDSEGRDLGVFRVTGASHRDWEDMASFRVGRRGYLVLADVGDNARKRKQCAIYIAEEPRVTLPVKGPIRRPASTLRKRPASAKVIQQIRFVYEDGPHNCESVAIDAKARTIYLVSKVAGLGCKVYALPIPARKTPKPSVAKAVATLGIPVTTAMDMSPDGLRVVVLTYGNAFEFTREPGEKWGEAFGRKPRVITMPRRPQGESICYGSDGKTLYLTSEVGKSKGGCPLYEVAEVK